MTVSSATNWQAASTPAVSCTGDSDWDARIEAYLRLTGLQAADLAFGAYARASEEFAAVRGRLKDKYGQNYRSHPDGNDAFQAAFGKLNQAEGDLWSVFLAPCVEAAEALMRTPAPTLPAALYKIELIAREEIGLDEGEGMALVAADMDRLARATPVDLPL